MFETVPWLSWMSFTIKHKHFKPYISIFHIYELSITSLCSKPQCAPPPQFGIFPNFSQIWFDGSPYFRYITRYNKDVLKRSAELCNPPQPILAEQHSGGWDTTYRDYLQRRSHHSHEDSPDPCPYPLLFHHFLGIHRQPSCGLCCPPQQEHEKHHKPSHT